MLVDTLFVEVLGHAGAATGFSALAGFVSMRRRALVRTLRRAPVVYGLILLVSVLIALANGYCAVDLLVSGHQHDSTDPLYILARHPASVAVSLLLMALVGAKLVAVPAQRPRRVLAIGAHPDDLEIACGATLARMRDAGHQVHGLILTCGEAGGDPDTRVHEAHAGAAFLGLSSVEVLSFADTRLATQATELTLAIEARVRALQPDIILTHSSNDQHQDHLAVHQATLRAARTHGAILCYESPSATREFLPSFFVDVSDYLDVKIESVRTHADQRGKPYVSAERLRGVALFRGSQARTRYAEGFEVVRALSSALGDI